jgi:hypothetical protein
MTDQHDEITHLGRVIRDESGLWSQMLEKGKWVRNPVVLQCLHDPLFGEQITKEEAEALAHRFGGTLS